jgi:hypothetical protein
VDLGGLLSFFWLDCWMLLCQNFVVKIVEFEVAEEARNRLAEVTYGLAMLVMAE